jgi:N-acyl-D-aspartate/D-glutamate deacylase
VLDAFSGWDKEYPIIDEVIRTSGRPATFTLASGNEGPPRWRTVLDLMEKTRAAGGEVTAQVMPRPIGLIGGLELSAHPFVLCPSWQKIASLSLADKVAAMRAPEMRQALLSETPDPGHPLVQLGRSWNWMFPLDTPPDYAPPLDKSFAAQAAARGISPEEFAYDFFLSSNGEGLFLAALGNYEDGKLDSAHEMLSHPYCVPGLGDGGAHYGAICDASYSTYLLTRFVRQGGDLNFSVAQAAHMLGAKSARAVGFHDRGMLTVGAKADLNVIDLDRLAIHLPEIVHDLPAGGRRLHQRATGYDATVVSGAVIRRMDESTGARPGKRVRGTA